MDKKVICKSAYVVASRIADWNKLSYRRETALQGALVLAKSRDDILRTI